MSKWLSNAVFYEIYPQSFYDKNGDGIGDFYGIIEKLDYIKELGCNAIWLNPCYLSPFDDAGYDVQDYYKVAPRYGTNEDLYNLFNEVHKRNMHIILDIVPGHTSYKHPWFIESMKPTKNEFSDRYVWTDCVWDAPNDMQWLRGISQRNGCVALNFFSTQPALNYGFYKCEKPWMQSVNDSEPRATLEEMMNVMRFWLSKGCDGFRVDMAGSLVKNDDEQKTGIIELWNKVRDFLDKEFPEAAMVSEWGEPDKSLAGGFHMDFLLHFGPSFYNDLFRCEEPYFSSRGKGNITSFLETYKKNYNKTNGKGLICIPSGNHDMIRLGKYLTQDEMKIAFAFLLSMPGAPFIYYGDEIGMRYVENLISVEGGYERTGSRSPMQWDNSENFGFSKANKDQIYIPVDNSVESPTAESQMKDVNSLRSIVKKLISVRKEHSALQSNASVEFLQTENYPLAYIRKNDNESVLVIINPSKKSYKVDLSNKTNLLTEPFFSIGGNSSVNGNSICIDGGTAVFYKIKY